MRARLAWVWPMIWSKNGLFESVSVFFTTYFGRGFGACRFVQICHNSLKFATGIILRLFGLERAACGAFLEGMKICLKQCLAAHSIRFKMPLIGRILPSKASSPTNRLSAVFSGESC